MSTRQFVFARDSADGRRLMKGSVDVLVRDLYFPEALRWHNGQLWFSDVFGGQVCRVSSSGLEVIAHLPGAISGLGWLPDGSTLVVSCGPRKLLRITPDGLISNYADLSGYLNFDANDMVVDKTGRAYIGNYGFDVAAGIDPVPTNLVRVNIDGTVVIEQPPLIFPNGAVLVDDGRGLVVAETFADRLSYLRIAEDGHLHDPRILAELPAGAGPDGITADEFGGIWVACAFGSAVVRITPDGQISDRIEFPGVGVYCCVLGGYDGHTLYVAIASKDESLAERERTGSIVTIRVSVPAVQVPGQ